MMTKKKTSASRRIKFAWALPAIALLLFAFAEPSYRAKEAGTENSISTIQKGEKEFTIKGKVIEEESGEALPGASIVIKGSTIGTVSDRDGTFTLVDPNPKVDINTDYLSTSIVISFVGLKTIDTVVKAPGKDSEKSRYTFLMKEEVIYASATFSDSKLPSPPPPPAKKEKEKLAPPPPPAKGAEQEVFYIVEDMPQFPGGSDALEKFVQDESDKYQLKGKAKIGFTVNAKGKVSDVKIVEADNTEIGKAASEIIASLPNWKPGAQRGKNVAVKYIIAVEFR